MQSRLQRLENLVLTMTKNSNSNGLGAGNTRPTKDGGISAPRKPLDLLTVRASREITENAQNKEIGDDEQVTGSFGRMNVNSEETNYVDAAHWISILDDVRAIPPAVSLASRSFVLVCELTIHLPLDS